MTGMSLAMGQKLLASVRPADPAFWALFSDTHLAAQREQSNNGVNMADNFEEVSRELLSLPKRPTGLFITGDCAFSSGQMGDYGMLTRMLEPIRSGKIPIHLALGNHDNRDRFWEALAEEKSVKRPLEDKQVALLRTRDANWFILDSLETTLATPGLIGQKQLEWLASALDANRKKPALVLVHHNPGFSGNLGLKDTAPFLEVIRPRRQVKAYIYGHTHHWKIEQDISGIHFVNLPPVSYVFSKGDPSGWVRAILKPDGMSLELRCVDRMHKEHGKVVKLEWRE